MNAYSITAPEEIAKKYGGNKKKIQQAAAQGLIAPTEAVMAGMFIDRMRNAAAQEQAQQPTVAEQVMNPQPQMPPQGMAATPQAQQMAQRPPQMGMPQAPQQMPPQGMAMGGGVNSIDYVEGNYAPGGIVGFNRGDAVRAEVKALEQRRDALRQALVDLENRPFYIGSEKQGLESQLAAVERRLAQGPSFAETPLPDTVEGGQDYPNVQGTPGQLNFQLPDVTAEAQAKRDAEASQPSSFNRYLNQMTTDYKDSQRLQDRARALAEAENAQMTGAAPVVQPTISSEEASLIQQGVNPDVAGLVGQSAGIPALVSAEQQADMEMTPQQRAAYDSKMRLAERRQNAPGVMDAFNFLRRTVGGRNLAASPGLDPSNAYLEQQGTADMNALDRANVEPTESGGGLRGLIDQGISSVVNAGKNFADAGGRDAVQSVSDTIKGLVSGDAEPDAFTGAAQKVAAEQQTNVESAPTVAQRVAETETEKAATEPSKDTTATTTAATTTDTTTTKQPEDDVLTRARATADAENKQMTGEAPIPEKGLTDYYNELEGLLKQEDGPATKELKELFGNRKETARKERAEALNMALIEFGFRVAGAPGGPIGQIIGQAGQKTLPGVTKAFNRIKKEDTENLRLIASMEQAEGKRKRELLKLASDRMGADKTNALRKDLQLLANQSRKQTAVISADAKVRAAEIATSAQKDLNKTLKMTELLRKFQTDNASVLEKISATRDSELMRVGPGLTYSQALLAAQKDPGDAEKQAKLTAAEKLFENHLAKLTKDYQGIYDSNLEIVNQLTTNLMPSGGNDVLGIR